MDSKLYINMQFLLSLIVLLCVISTSNAGHCQEMVCRSGCVSYQWLCGRSNGCMWNTEDEDCETSDGINDNECCLDDTTTTPSPTTPEPTTPEPTTPEPTTPEPTEDESWPTPQPTLKSAMKWEMIHPNYAGSDGELLWHVYYGDYSNDERFDSFRADEKWDATEIRPIFRSENGQLYNDDATIVSSAHETAQSSASYGMWILMLSIAVIVIFACWYRSSLISKDEITGLLEENKVQYNL